MNNMLSLIFRCSMICCIWLNSSCSFASGKTDQTALWGCTPGDHYIKKQLGIPDETIIDFIKWDLTLYKPGHHSFVLNIVYGESQPNTLGFKEGGKKETYRGEYRVSKDNGNEIYYLQSERFQSAITLQKLNPNIFHFLTSQNKLMAGNGGWSYTLNNKTPETDIYPLPTLTHSTALLSDTALQVIYEGRTPCQDFAAENNLTVNQSCFKLKWKLILSKDPKTLKPSTYLLKRTNSRETEITGQWTIKKGVASNPNAIILELDPDKPGQSIALLAGDENVLFFLHKDKNLFAGNDNFSYTLNKRQKPVD